MFKFDTYDIFEKYVVWQVHNKIDMRRVSHVSDTVSSQKITSV